jgi:O-antigen ligase
VSREPFARTSSDRRVPDDTMRVFRWILVATIAWGVLAFGAVYPWAYWPLGAMAAGLGGWAIRSSRAWRDPRVLRLAAALAAVVVAIAVQIIPLPYHVVSWLSPGLDGFLRAFELGFQPPARHTLSLAPAHTVVALFLCAALSMLLIGLTRTIRHLPLEWIVSQLMGLGVALAVVGIVQKGFLDEAAPLVYGFWRPQQLGSPFGPFINRNHFAGWMVMVLPIVAMYAVGLLYQAPRPVAARSGAWLRWLLSLDGNRIVLVAFVAVVMGTALVSTASRSGVTSFAAAALVMLAFIVPRLGGRQRLAALTYVGAVVVGAIVWAGSDMVAARFATGPDTLDGRLSAWRDTVAIIRDFPVFGVGLGAYARAMLMYQTEGRELMYAQAHNEYFQLAAEGGLLVGVPAAVAFSLVVTGIRRRLRADEDDPLTFWIRRGAVAGLVGIVVQSLVEFSLQMPGNAILFVLVLAIALHRPRPAVHARRI